jgi:hypothetical protein
MGAALDDGRCGRLDEVGDARGRKALAQRADRGRRENDVTNLAKPDEENPGSGRDAE